MGWGRVSSPVGAEGGKPAGVGEEPLVPLASSSHVGQDSESRLEDAETAAGPPGPQGAQ